MHTDSKQNRQFPLGERGELPVFVPCALDAGRWRELVSLPGVAGVAGGLRCTYDMLPHLCRMLDIPAPTIPTDDQCDIHAEALALPGLQRYRDLGLGDKLRDYQKVGAVFLARRAYAMNADPMRSGKTLQALAASVLTDADKVLIVCPALAKLVWADEACRWLKEEALLLEGRSATRGRIFCGVCGGRGRDPETGIRCAACRGKNGGSWGTRIVRDDALEHALRNKRYVIVNYDLLVGQQGKTETGQTYLRPDLPGWAGRLSSVHFDLCIADESHLLRGWTPSAQQMAHTRRERFNQAVEHIRQVWLLTGTPVFGYIRDLWGQLDAMSKGAFTGPSRLPFDFHVRYADGHKGEYGWVATGTTPHTLTELTPRLDVVKIQRPRSLILADMPAKVRTVYRIDPPAKAKSSSAGAAGHKSSSLLLRQAQAAAKGGGKKKVTTLLSQTSTAKRPQVVDNVLAELSAGMKVVVFSLLRKNADALFKALKRGMQGRAYGTRMRKENAEIWLGHGDITPALRFAYARAFVEHPGAAVFVSTIDAMQVAVSLRGAESVHFADLHYSPAAMLQAEDRPYEPGTAGLAISYYVVKDSIDEQIEAAVLPKFKTQEEVVKEEGATAVQAAFAPEDETIDQILSRLAAHLNEPDDDLFDDLDDT